MKHETNKTVVFETMNTVLGSERIYKLFFVKIQKQICPEGGWVYTNRYPNNFNENSITNYEKTFRNKVVDSGL